MANALAPCVTDIASVGAESAGGLGVRSPRAPRVAVVVSTRDSAAVVGGLLDTLHAGMAGVDWTLTVSDRGSLDETVGVVRYRAPYARVVPAGRSAGHADGVNAGLWALGALPARRGAGWHDAVLLLDASVRLDRGCGLALLATLDAEHADGTRAGIVVPRVYDSQGRLAHSLRRAPTRLRALGGGVLGHRLAGRVPGLGERVTARTAYRRPTVATWADGGALLVSTACLRVCGGWPTGSERAESKRAGCERAEVEYALRARDHGYHVRLAPAARVLDVAEPSPAGEPTNVWTGVRSGTAWAARRAIQAAGTTVAGLARRSAAIPALHGDAPSIGAVARRPRERSYDRR